MKKIIPSLLMMVLTLTPLLTRAQESEPSQFFHMLNLVPDTESLRMEPGGMIAYSDLAASQQALHFAGFEDAAAFENASDEERRLFIQSTTRAGYFGFANYLMVSIPQMPQLVGFAWSDVDQVMEWGVPPNHVDLLAGDFDPEGMATALSARDFEQVERDGVNVWYRFEDNEVNIAAREPGDPFGGELGASARIAELPGMLANARSWGVIEQVIATSANAHPSVLDAPDFRALAEALEDTEYYTGDLIAAILFGTAASLSTAMPPGVPPEMFAPNATLEPQPTPDPATVLPPYLLLGMADRQEGEDTVHLIGMVYPDAATAEIAAQVLYDRWVNDQYLYPDFMEHYDIRFDAPHVYTSAEGISVAVVGVRYTIVREPVEWGGINEPGIPQPGIIFALWYRLFSQRDLYFLASEPRGSMTRR